MRVNGVKALIKSREAQKIQKELAKWGSCNEYLAIKVVEFLPKRKRGRPVGLRKAKRVSRLQRGESSGARNEPEAMIREVAQVEVIKGKGKAIMEAS
ncbi:hypothetical protein SUGI_1058190 [Cryptomeria japonica]|nr:hypothetical protein SUGI_1058190 [Cryptomeria japonica]